MAVDGQDRLYVGFDVGTGSARAGVFDAAGRMLAAATHGTMTWRPETEFVEQSSANIWRALCLAAAQAMADAGAKPEQVRGIGFAATCSLVVLDDADNPVTVSPTSHDDQNVIVWMDHRAIDQAHRISASGHEVLKCMGGTISPEMQPPKLLWLKEALGSTWKRAAHFFDLSDFLVYRATGHDVRSLCSTVCKWTYRGHDRRQLQDRGGPTSTAEASEVSQGWDDGFFRQVGLEDLADEGYKRIGTRVRPVGEPVGDGLTQDAARQLGLLPGTPVGVSVIDGHAGCIGLLGARLHGAAPTIDVLQTRLALIGGASNCHMSVSRYARFIAGVCGPYFSTMIPGMWLTEGGQSAAGALVDHVIFSHPRASDLMAQAKSSGQTVYELLNQRVETLARDLALPAELTRELHVLPYFHGNRSPRADATLRGMVSGLTLDDSENHLALLYLATIQAIAHGMRHIIDTLKEHGCRFDTVFVCGGGTKNPLFLREYADITGCQFVLPREPEAVLLGTAILGAVASVDFGSVLRAMATMNHVGDVVRPGGRAVLSYHQHKHAVFQRMYTDQIEYRKLMK